MATRVRPGAEMRARELLEALHTARVRTRLDVARQRVEEAIAVAGGSALDAYLIDTHGDLQARQQAEQLGVGRSVVISWRQRLYRLGKLRETERCAGPPITAAETAAVVGLYRQGYSALRIGEMRETSEHRIYVVLARAGVRSDQRPPLLNARSLGRALGVGEHTIRRLVDLGWLSNARVGAATRGGNYGWSRADVCDLLRVRASWLVLSPSMMSDTEFATYLRLQQEASGGQWYTRDDLCRLLSLSLETCLRWIARRGLVEGLPATEWGTMSAVWLTHAQARAAAAAAAPIAAVRDSAYHVRRSAALGAYSAIYAALRARQVRAVAAD